MKLNINNIIQSIDNDLNNGKIIFSHESQFQFELAWRIKTQHPEYDILFEAVYYNNEDKKHCYTDLVIIDNESKEYIPIELKYKTKKRDTNDKLLKNQGAQDNSVYDYLKDLSRIEYLKKNHKKQFEFYDSYQNYEFFKGYAIIITNDRIYYKGGKEDKLAKNFTIKHGADKHGKTDWFKQGKKSCVDGTERDKPISLGGKYKCNWEPDPTKNDDSGKTFYYLILEVN